MLNIGKWNKSGKLKYMLFHFYRILECQTNLWRNKADEQLPGVEVGVWGKEHDIWGNDI